MPFPPEKKKPAQKNGPGDAPAAKPPAKGNLAPAGKPQAPGDGPRPDQNGADNQAQNPGRPATGEGSLEASRGKAPSERDVKSPSDNPALAQEPGAPMKPGEKGAEPAGSGSTRQEPRGAEELQGASGSAPNGPAVPPRAGSTRPNAMEEFYANTTEQTFQESVWDIETQRKPYNPDDLWRKRGNYSIYREMENDDQVSVCLDLKRDLVLGGGFDIVSEDQDHAELVEDLEVALREDPDRGFEEALEEVLDAFGKGFSLSEKLFKQRPDGTLGFRDLKTRAPDTWLIHTNKQGHVTRFEQQGTGGESADVDPRVLLHYVNRPRFQNPYGRSDLRSAYQPWFTKREVIRYYSIFLEKAASPTAVGRYDRNAPPSAVDDIYASLKKLQANTALVVPKEVELEFLEAKSNGEAFIRGINIFNMFIGRSLMIPDLLGFQGDETSGGSYSLGKDQMMVLFKHIYRRRSTLERMVNKQIVEPIVVWNHGVVPKYPKFKLRPIQDDVIIELAKLWLEAQKFHAYVPTQQEINHFRKLAQFPADRAAEEADKAAQAAKKQVQVPGSPGAAKPQVEPGAKPGSEEPKAGGLPAEPGKETSPPAKPGQEPKMGPDGLPVKEEPGTSPPDPNAPPPAEGTPAIPGQTPVPDKPAANSALNGTQVTSMIQIVEDVAAEKIPRDSGVQMLVTAFNITPEVAEKIMGEVGNTFVPAAPDPAANPFGGGPPGGSPPGGGPNADDPNADPNAEGDAGDTTDGAPPKPGAKAPPFGGKKPPASSGVPSDKKGPPPSGAKGKPFKRVYAMPPGDYAKKCDFKALGAAMDSNLSRVLDQAAPVIKTIYEDLYAQIQRKKILSGQRADKLESLKLKGLGQLKAVLKRAFITAHQDARAAAAKELEKGKAEYKLPLPDEKFLEVLEAETFAYIGDWAYNVTKQARIELMAAIRDGTPLSEVIGILDDKGRVMSEDALERYARTKFTEVTNRGRLEAFNESGVVAAYQYSAILDDRTTEVCAGLDGKVFAAGDQPVPPLHFNCRSLLVPITKYEEWSADSKVGRTPIDQFIEDNKGDGFARYSVSKVLISEDGALEILMDSEEPDEAVVPFRVAIPFDQSVRDLELVGAPGPGLSVFITDLVVSMAAGGYYELRAGDGETGTDVIPRAAIGRNGMAVLSFETPVEVPSNMALKLNTVATGIHSVLAVGYVGESTTI